MENSIKRHIGTIDQQALDLEGLGHFGDDFIYIPVNDSQVKTGKFNSSKYDQNAPDESDNDDDHNPDVDVDADDSENENEEGTDDT